MKYEFVIGTNAARDVTNGTIGSMMGLREVPYRFGWDIIGCGSAARTRNILAYRFLKENQAPFLIFIDRDMVFTPQDVGKLLDSLNNGYDLIAGCYAIHNTMWLTSGGEGGESEPVLDGTIKEVKYLATGFMGITRKLLEKMVEGLKLPLMHKGDDTTAYPFFEEKYYQDPDCGDMWLSEDYDFCHKARQVGVKSYLDTSVRLGHLGGALWQVDGTIASKNRMEVPKEVQEQIRKILSETASATVPENSSQQVVIMT